ncbi:MAG: MGMT family protein [Dehalococcoidia bacterium]|nr:MGMT family protein [Dehalococcoidia bacterium]
MAARAAAEAAAGSVKDITPYWRMLKTGGELNPKYPGGVEAQTTLLQKEGHTIISGKGKKSPTVKDYEKKLVEV